MAQAITHQGIVKNISGNQIRVQIIQASACASCVAKKMCNSAESKEKLIDVTTPEASEFAVGESVLLTGTLKTGLQAVLWAYAVPLILLVAVVLAVGNRTDDEPLAALAALAVLACYYLLLYLNRKRLSRKFSFTIKHQN